MKQFFKTTLLAVTTTLLSFNATAQDDLVTKAAHIKFYSEEGGITANNYAVVSKLNTKTGEMIFSAPIQSFEFENATMQKHFNQEGIMNSQSFPKGKFVGKIDNISNIDLSKDGEYDVTVSGKLTIKGKTNDVSTKGKIIVKDGKIMASSKFTIDRFAYGVEGKSQSVSQHIDLTINATFK